MPNRNKTNAIGYRFLTRQDFSAVHKTFLLGFADPPTSLKMTTKQFENHIAQNAVDLELSVGAFSGGKLVGCSLNGFGTWNGKKTAYDAGTCVIPRYRNKAVGTSLFDLLMPTFREIGVKQMLLEVPKDNERARQLYSKVGFKDHRTFLSFEHSKDTRLTPQNGFEIRQIEGPDWKYLRCFWDGYPSGQSSPDSIDRRLLTKTILGAYIEDQCVGYLFLRRNRGWCCRLPLIKSIGGNVSHHRCCTAHTRG